MTFKKLLLGLACAAAAVPAGAQGPISTSPSQVKKVQLGNVSDYRVLEPRIFVHRETHQVIAFAVSEDGKLWLWQTFNGLLLPIANADGTMVEKYKDASIIPNGRMLSLQISGARYSIPLERGEPILEALDDGTRLEYAPVPEVDEKAVGGRIEEMMAGTSTQRIWGPLVALAGKSFSSENLGWTILHHWDWMIDGFWLAGKQRVFDRKQELDDRVEFLFVYDPVADAVFRRYADGSKRASPGPDGAIIFAPPDLTKTELSDVFEPSTSGYRQYQLKTGKDGSRRRSGSIRSFGEVSGSSMDEVVKLYLDRQPTKVKGGGFLAAATGAIMGGATGYAQSGGSSVGAVAGAMGGAVVGKAGGNDALYQQMQTANAQATADAEASQRQLQRTIAQAQRGSASGAGASGPAERANAGASLVATTGPAPVAAKPAPAATTDHWYWQCEAAIRPNNGKSTYLYSRIGTLSAERGDISFNSRTQSITPAWTAFLQGSGIAFDASVTPPSCGPLSSVSMADAQSRQAEVVRSRGVYNVTRQLGFTPSL